MLRGDPLASLAAGGETPVDIGKERIDRFGIGWRIVGRNQPAAVADDVSHAWPVLGQDRAALRLRFEIDHAECLADARPYEKVRPAELAGDAVLVQGACKGNPIRELRKQRFNLSPRRSIADDV